MKTRTWIIVPRAFLLAFIGAAGGCLTTTQEIAPDFVPNESEGLVYGRMELVVDGHAIQSGWAGVTVALSRYAGEITVLDQSFFDQGEFVIDARSGNGGHYVAKLPVGKYYVGQIIYVNARFGTFTHWRTYSEATGAELERPMLMTFDVLPGKATYLGNLRHLVNFRGPAVGNQEVTFDLQLVDDQAPSTAHMVQQFANLGANVETRLLQTRYLDKPVDQSSKQ